MKSKEIWSVVVKKTIRGKDGRKEGRKELESDV